MQTPTEPTPAGPRGDEAELYRQHHRALHRAVAHAVRAPQELIEDACQTAWTTLLRVQPGRHAVFAWLRVVAIHEAYRLSAIDRREATFQLLRPRHADRARGRSGFQTARRRRRSARGASGSRIASRAPADRPRSQARRLHPRGDPRTHIGTHEDQRQQVPPQGAGARSPFAIVSCPTRFRTTEGQLRLVFLSWIEMASWTPTAERAQWGCWESTWTC
jgi:hypothetical protein